MNGQEPVITDQIVALVADLAEYQLAEGLTDGQMAEKLGIPRTTWTAARNGRFRPGLPFVQRVALIPEFRDRAARVLLPDVDSQGDTEVAVGPADDAAGAGTAADANRASTPPGNRAPVSGSVAPRRSGEPVR